MSLISFLQFWRRNVKASSPDLNLLFAVFLNGFHFVQSLQWSVMPFIQSPWLDDWNVMAIQLISCVVEGLNSSGKDRGVANIELEAVLLEYFACLDGFLNTLIIGKVPLADNLTSVHPVNLFYLFQLLSPWRKKTTRCFFLKIYVYCCRKGVFVDGWKHYLFELLFIKI